MYATFYNRTLCVDLPKQNAFAKFAMQFAHTKYGFFEFFFVCLNFRDVCDV